ncbi:hypothetical protein [Fibrobacter sp. UWS1]|uniref:hypothetical protein n=1 Tax=Fibrobacter sp. UWS1 TaxID=1896220 RepID=UPI000BB10E7D|nr:hypothetical protein [Fibrobacter sp. UWS1]PBC67264.1 hypothetical protein BGX14_2911 [Fibrobacter sp. UWS1]
MKKFGNVALLAVAMIAFACVCMWGCGVDDGWGEREFRAYDVAKVVGFVDDSLVILADSREWMQETPDYAIGGHGHQRIRVFNYRVQEDGPRWTDTLDNFVDECDYVLGQLSDSVVWGGQTSLYTKVWKGPLMTFWKIGEKPIVKNISVETERCSQTFFVKNMRSWIEETIIVLSEKSLRYGGDTCQYAVLDTVAGTLTFKRLDENLKWIQKCDDVRAWGDDVYCVILDNEGENSLILKNINDTISTPRKFAIGGFWGNMIKLSGNICSIHDDEITCSDVIWYGNELANFHRQCD